MTLAKELERRFAASGGPLASVRCLSVHPGNVLTGVVRTLPRAVQVAYRVVMGAFGELKGFLEEFGCELLA